MRSAEVKVLGIRHGQSVLNSIINARIQGRGEGEHNVLTPDKGRGQVYSLARELLRRRIQPIRIISSPLVRARETAELIAIHTNKFLQIEFDPDLQEMSKAGVENHSRKDAPKVQAAINDTMVAKARREAGIWSAASQE